MRSPKDPSEFVTRARRCQYVLRGMLGLTWTTLKFLTAS